VGPLLDVRLLLAVAAAAALVAVIGVRRPDWLLPGAAALGVILCRPSAIGERVPVLGPALLALVGVVALVGALRHRTRDVGVFPWPFLLFGTAWVWLGVHRLLNPLAEPNLATSTLTVFLPVVVLYLVVRDRDLLARTRTALVALVVVSATLTVVALALVLVLGPGTTLLGSVPLGYAGAGATDAGAGLYLPGALAYGVDPGALFPRMLGLGREPGMGALVLGWAFFAMPESFPRAVLCKAVLLLALLGTQSTAGIGIAGVCLVLQAVLGRRTFSPLAAGAATVAGVATVYLAVYDPTFGLLSKSQSGMSFSTRNQATLDGLTALTTHPFTATSTAPLSSVNLVAAIAVNGAPWFVLGTLLLLAPVLRAGRRDPLRYGSLLVLMVMLTAQPLAGNAGVLLLAIIAYYAADRPTVRDPSPAALSSLPVRA